MRVLSFILVLINLWTQGSTSVCSDQGIFTNPEDNQCETYIFCFRLPDGVFIEKTYYCPNGTLFNPVTKQCKENHLCEPPTLPTPSTSTSETSTVFECTSQGKFPEINDDTCSRYFFCYYLPTGKYIKMNYTCPSATKFDPKLQTCTSRFQCTSFITNSSPSTMSAVSESTSSLLMSVTPKSFSCSQQGRFPVAEDVTCRSYYYCLLVPGGSFTQQIYLCPSDMKFNPVTQTCSQDYQCPPQTTPSTIRTSTLSPTKKSTITTEAQTTEDMTISTEAKATDKSTTTEAQPTANTNSVCLSSGRFPDLTDPTCRTYFYCVQIPGGSLESQTYRCPKDANFNPKTQICDIAYKCLNAELITPRTESTTFSILTTPLIEEKTVLYTLKTTENLESSVSFEETEEITQLSNKFTSSTGSSTLSILSTPWEEATIEISSWKPTELGFSSERMQKMTELTNHVTFEKDLITTSAAVTTDAVHSTCTTVGRFPDISDDTCVSYILCIMGPDGKLLSIKYKCEFNELFDPNLGACSASYTCHGDSGCTSTGIPRDNTVDASDDYV